MDSVYFSSGSGDMRRRAPEAPALPHGQSRHGSDDNVEKGKIHTVVYETGSEGSSFLREFHCHKFEVAVKQASRRQAGAGNN